MQGFTLFGRDISQIPCFRNSFLYGIGGGIGIGLLTFLGTSRTTFSTHVGFGTFFCGTIAYWSWCRWDIYWKWNTKTMFHKFNSGTLDINGRYDVLSMLNWKKPCVSMLCMKERKWKKNLILKRRSIEVLIICNIIF